MPIKVHWRKTGSSNDEFVELSPGATSGNITVSLTTARTVEYYIEGGGSISCTVVDYGGSGNVVTTVTVADIRTTLLDSGYSTDDISNAAIQGYIDIINAEVTDAATRHANIAGFTLGSAIKTNAIKMGALAQTLQLLRNKGASQGLQAQRIAISSETENEWWNKYAAILANIRSGIVYGA